MDKKLSTDNATHGMMDAIFSFFERFIYGGRWVIAPMYVGLLIALVIYTYKFITQLIELCEKVRTITEADLMLSVLSLIDTVMIGNLILLIMIGSYAIFVRKFEIEIHERPHWLEHITSGTLKIKMGMSLIGVSSIHLLKDFIGTEAWNLEFIGKHVIIHIVFIISTIALAYTERISHGGENKHI